VIGHRAHIRLSQVLSDYSDTSVKGCPPVAEQSNTDGRDDGQPKLHGTATLMSVKFFVCGTFNDPLDFVRKRSPKRDLFERLRQRNRLFFVEDGC